jgi:Mg-chelatase subunit ChlD
MEVRDRLACLIAIVQDEPEVLGNPALARDAPDRLEQLPTKDLVLEVGEPLYMLLGDHKDVERRAREDVIDRHDVVVLIDDGRRDLSGHDAAEQAVIHAAKRIPTWP